MPVELEVLELVGIFVLAAGVAIVSARLGNFPYTVALLISGLVVSILGIHLDITFTHSVLLFVLIPPLLFEGGVNVDIDDLRNNFWIILALAGPGLILSVPFLGFLGHWALGLPLISALLFGSIILPTDPVSVLALFKELGAPSTLSIVVEGESMMNDGIGVVVFTALVAALNAAGGNAYAIFEPVSLLHIFGGILFTSIGGVAVGLGAAAAVYVVMSQIDDQMTEIILTFTLAYGSFVCAEYFFSVSGVIAAATAGIFIGNYTADTAMTPRTKVTFFTIWEAAAFIVNTLFFLLLGTSTPIGDIIANIHLIAIAIGLVLLARFIMVYAFTNALNPFISTTVPRKFQHVIFWGGVRASIPIALVLGLAPDIPYRAEIQAMVFGVAAFSLLVQGLSMPLLIDRLGIVTRGDADRVYELLVGRLRAVNNALSAVRDLQSNGSVPPEVYQEFVDEYETEKDDLHEGIRRLLEQHPEIREEEVIIGERRVLTQEKTAIMDAMRSGIIGDDVGEQLLDDVDLKLDRVESGEKAIAEETERQQYWRNRLTEFGIDLDAEET